MKTMDCNNHDIEILPERLFKYYSFDLALNKSRLTGDVYLASPLDFNDPFDCQLDVENNILSINKNDDWIKGKLFEIGISENHDELIAKLKRGDNQTIEIIRKKQLEKLGVLCLTSSHNNNIVWGYYTDNKGFCIEYDRDKIIHQLIIGFINKLSWELTRYLFEDKRYNQSPHDRTPKHSKARLEYANKLFCKKDVELITNDFLTTLSSKEEDVVNFVNNIYIKRFGGGIIQYGNEPISTTKPQLFFNNQSQNIQSKYYTKSREWSEEKEYRFAVSLGGRTVVSLGKECIKSIRVGCNISHIQLFEIISILSSSHMDNIELIKMTKDISGLKETALNLTNLIELHKKFKDEIKPNSWEKQ